MKKVFIFLVRVYQRFFSVLSYGSCRYSPTCSEYALMQIKNEFLPLAIVNSILRILRCNQLFVGGMDYPIVRRAFKERGFSLNVPSDSNKGIVVEYWLVKKSKNRYFLIKNFLYKGS